MVNKKYAKSRLANGKQPTVQEHLSAVAAFAGEYGKEIGTESAARLEGHFHDFGKYGDLFQCVLTASEQGIDHALPGAAILANLNRSALNPVLEAIAAHHSELISARHLIETLKRSVNSDEPVISPAGKRASLSGKVQYQEAWNCFLQDFPGFTIPKLSIFRGDEQTEDYFTNIQKMLFTRMLFSCLVDADYTVSAMEEDETYADVSEVTEFDAESQLSSLRLFAESIRSGSSADSKLNQLRDELYERCGNAGEENVPGLFSLTAPTGTGKTLALLHFALRHCARWGKKRIILVLPFLTLTEQSAKTYRDILPHVLEDHSQSNLTDLERQFSARWRYPVIITTSVKFFESLFSAKPADCRKLHNIANSVILFDEAQSLPPELTEASLIAVRELCRSYGCTTVFSTATQPDYCQIRRVRDRWAPREILSDYAQYYSALNRTSAEWRLEQATPLENIAKEMLQEHNVCVIVNLRRHARKLFQLLQGNCPEEELFMISTDLCPAHRSEVIEKIKARQKAGLRSVVVSTQCIEAGVDLDFAVVFRALAPLDSIVQAAGRCNRNGKQQGKVVIFEPDEPGGLYPRDWNNWYHNAAQTTKRLNSDKLIDIGDPKDIQRYYSALFAGLKDQQKLERAVKNLDYSETAQEYRLIKNDGIRVIVPFIGLKEEYDEIIQEARASGLTGQLLKRAAPLTVSVFSRKDMEIFLEPIPFKQAARSPDGTLPNSGYYCLRVNQEICYKQRTGLQFPDESNFDSIF